VLWRVRSGSPTRTARTTWSGAIAMDGAVKPVPEQVNPVEQQGGEGAGGASSGDGEGASSPAGSRRESLSA
jgi:hypothetical protein